VAVVVSAIVLVQYPESWQIVGWLVVFDSATIAYQLILFQRNTVRRFKHSRLWQDTASVFIDGKAIRMTGQTFDKAREWSDFSDIFEFKRVFMFVTAGRRVLFLPKSGMDESQIVELRTLISTYANGKIRLDRS
jgi:YcxB-like protein